MCEICPRVTTIRQRCSRAVDSCIADALVETHKELETKTKTALMQTAAKAAVDAAQKPPLEVSNTSQLRDLASAAARIFGWDTKQPQTQINQLCITREQLQEIRALREQLTLRDARKRAMDDPSAFIAVQSRKLLTQSCRFALL
jgi:hypothetical protein